jgi:hypothetical protein
MPSTTIDRPARMTDEEWQEACKRLGVVAKASTPVKTGRLRDGWSVNASANSVTLSNDVPYADYVDKGTSRMSARNMTKAVESEAQDILRKFLKA